VDWVSGQDGAGQQKTVHLLFCIDYTPGAIIFIAQVVGLIQYLKEVTWLAFFKPAILIFPINKFY
jgi:hypothetical protein